MLATPRCRWTVVLLAALLGGAILEGGLRLAGVPGPSSVALVLWNPGADRELDAAEALHRTDPDCLWSPRPGAALPWAPRETIHSGGYRGPRRSAEPAPGVARIVAVGESTIFGAGVPYEATGCARLERLLSGEGRAVEVVDLGVMNHTAVLARARYGSLGRGLHPDVVLLALGVVNESNPSQAGLDDGVKLARWRERGSVLGWSRRYSRALDVACGWFESLGAGPPDDPESSGDPAWPGVRRVSLADFRQTLNGLIDDVLADGAVPVLVSMPRAPHGEERIPVLAAYSAAIEQVARERSVLFADVRADFRAAWEEGRDPAEDFPRQDAWHLRPAGHAHWTQSVLPVVREALAREGSAALPEHRKDRPDLSER